MTENATQTIETLLKRNLLEIFGERDVAKRRAVIAEIWSEDGLMVDSHGRAVCHEALNASVSALHARLPGFVFTPRGEPEVFNGIGRQAWAFGPAGEAPKVTGVDIIAVENGRVASLFVFLDATPSA